MRRRTVTEVLPGMEQQRTAVRPIQAARGRQPPPAMGGSAAPEKSGTAAAAGSVSELRKGAGVMPGWRPLVWAARLRQMAENCRALQPRIARDYEQWAAAIEAREASTNES